MSSEREREADRLFERALLAITKRDYEDAASLLAQTIARKPRLAEAWTVRGNVRMAQSASFDAILHYEEALRINPGMYDAWNNRGVALSNLARWQEAEHCMRRSYDIMPSLDPCINLANMYAMRCMLPEGEEQYRKALVHEPGNLDCTINLGLMLLGQKKWKEGWEHYEVRHANTPYEVRQRRLFPQWIDQPLEGKTIMLWPEQGLGDEIAFMRFATDLKRKRNPRRLILESVPPLVRLARGLEGVDEVAIKNDTSPLGVDYACALMDVPMRLDVEADDFFAPASYLRVPDNCAAPALPHGFNVGLCWQAGIRPLQPEARATAANKSVPLIMFKPLTEMDINIISLQRENRIYKDDAVLDNEPERNLVQQFGIIDHMDQISDLADTAALIDQLDLVISVDTSVAHLAGAMGKPVWNLVRHGGYWPWLDATRMTRWYPSMTIYRQPQTFDWWEPLRRMFVDLEALLAQRQAA